MKHSFWKYKTCEKCEFRVNVECRRFPPTICTNQKVLSLSNSDYPRVINWENNMYQDACSEYKEELIKNCD